MADSLFGSSMDLKEHVDNKQNLRTTFD